MLPPPPKNRKPKTALTGTQGEAGDDAEEGEAKGNAPGRAKQIQGKKTDAPAVWDDHSRWGNTRKTTLSEMCGSNDLKMRRRLLKSETPQMQEVFSLLLLNVFLKS